MVEKPLLKKKPKNIEEVTTGKASKDFLFFVKCVKHVQLKLCAGHTQMRDQFQMPHHACTVPNMHIIQSASVNELTNEL